MTKVVTGWLRVKSNILKVNFYLHSEILHKSEIDEIFKMCFMKLVAFIFENPL